MTENRYRLMEFWNNDDNFITALPNVLPTLASDTFLTADFFASLSTYYFFNHSGNRLASRYLNRVVSITSAIYTEDGLLVTDESGNTIVISLESFNSKVSKDLAMKYGQKWKSLDDLFIRDYNAFDKETYQETETPDITKESTKSKSQNVTISDTGEDTTTSKPTGKVNVTTTSTDQVSAFNETGFSDNAKNVSSSDTAYEDYQVKTTDTKGTSRTTTASAEDNKETTTATEKGTRTHTRVHTGGSDLWERVEEYKAFISETLMDIIVKDIDNFVSVPYYVD